MLLHVYRYSTSNMNISGGVSYTYTEMSGYCDQYDNYKENYANDIDWDTDYDSKECLQSCLDKSKRYDSAVGCFFDASDGMCTFIIASTFVGSSEQTWNDQDTCWMFRLGSMFNKMAY